ncbi:hypothetical protein H6768_01185 [Candidatus Peribacteria bacterium]|nr:hypothetical protein [Candidatus Peribacteria bacterium]
MFGDFFGQLVHIDAEDFIKEALISLFSETGPIHAMIYDISIAPKIEQLFDQISCCFDLKSKRGTYLFWYVDEENMRHSLWRDGKNLSDTTGKYTIELSPDCINHNLKIGKIIPSGLLVYTILNCYF